MLISNLDYTQPSLWMYMDNKTNASVRETEAFLLDTPIGGRACLLLRDLLPIVL